MEDIHDNGAKGESPRNKDFDDRAQARFVIKDDFEVVRVWVPVHMPQGVVGMVLRD